MDGACPGDDLVLTVTNPVEGLTYGWWSNASCTGAPLYEGVSYAVNNIQNSTTYYVRAYSGSLQLEHNFSFTGSEQVLVVPAGATQAILQVWGAQGGGQQVDGNSNLGVGGNGGYSIGTMPAVGGETLYIYVGGQGSTSNNVSAAAPGGWNGGGTSFGSSSSDPAGGGGGATDIRLNGNSLYDRIIVAGGGGGGGEDSEQGGYGGGTSCGGSYAATQSSSGTGGVFGIGASTQYDGGAGGGGWYGAGAGGGSQTIPTTNSTSDGNGGSGGSGYVWTASTASYAPSGYLVSSSYYLANAQTIDGSTTFTAPNGGTETGHAGNGYARITFDNAIPECGSVITAVPVVLGTSPYFTLSASSSTSCNHDPVTLTISGYSSDIVRYEWSDGHVGQETSYVVIPGSTTTYTVSAYNDFCATEHSVTIMVDAPAVTLSGNDNGNCVEPGSEITVTVSGGVDGEVVVGSMESTDAYLPLLSCYNYNSSEQIYLPSEIGGAGYITSISFYMTSWVRNGTGIRLFMRNTNKNSFSSTSDWVTMTNADLVASNVSFPSSSTTGWQTITLDQPFYYDGTSNLLVGLDADYQSWSCSNNYYYYTTGAYRSLTFWDDNYSCFLTSPTEASDMLSYNAYAKFNIVANANYAWSNGQTDRNITVTPNETTTFTVTVTDGEHQCPAIMDYTVHVKPNLEVSPENPMVCPGGTVTLTASGADSYAWSNNVTSAAQTVGVGSYTVTATNADGCYAVENVTVASLSTPSAGEIADMVVCQSDYEITIASVTPATGGGNVEYSWRIGSNDHSTVWSENPEYTLTDAERTALGTGSCTVTRYYRDACSNTGSTTATLTINPPMDQPTVTGVRNIYCGQSTALTASSSVQGNIHYRWYSDPQGQNLVYEGSEFNTPALDATTTYYLQTVDIPVGDVPIDFNYTGSVQTWTVPGGVNQVQLEVWGAEGGYGTDNSSVSSNQGGKGGYSTGLLNVQPGDVLNVYVGGQGQSSVGTASVSFSGGYNGGGSTGNSGHSGSGGGAGGGASDVRINDNSLYARVIVAGGGGGWGYASSTTAGAGGGTTGIEGIGSSSSDASATGGTQTTGGTCSGSYGGVNGTSGTFGVGGSGGQTGSNAGGGGGGWYGGAGGKSGDGNVCKPGGGGSGYVYTASTASNYPAGCLLNSGYYLTDAQTIAGNTSFPAPNGGTETGHSGNGFARITITEMAPSADNCPSVLLAVTVTVNQAPAPEVDIRSACIGEPSELVVVNPVEGFQYQWSSTSDFSNIEGTGVTFTPTVQAQTTYYVRSVVGDGQEVHDFAYTGSEQSYTIPAGVSRVQLEVWGAQGGEGSYDYLSADPGRGGYATGILNVTAGDVLNIYVGGQGQHGLVGTQGAPVMGGFNGGGNSGYNGSSNYDNGGGSGGGATDVRINSTSLYARAIVAGGGGGGGNSWENTAATGGAGGGENGVNGVSGGSAGAAPGTSDWGSPGGGGTINAGGVAGSYGGYTGTAGSFGLGGNGYTGSTYSAGGGGGGGWYGGGPGSQGNSAGSGGGGGGSGYVYTASTASNYPAGCLLNSSNYLTETQNIAGTESFLSPEGIAETGHAGNGFARITLLDMATDYCPSAVRAVEVDPVTAPQFTVTPSSNTYCAGDEAVTFTISGASLDIERYEWSDNTSTTETTYTVTPGHTTTYTVTAYNSACGLASQAFTIAVDAPEVTVSGSDNGECVEPGTEVTLTVDGGGINGEVSVGTMDNSSYNVLPLNSCYNYNSSESIYTAAEIGSAGWITSISYYVSSWMRNGNGVRLFMRNTNKNSFSSTSDWVTMTDADIVAANVTFPYSSNTGWQTINLDQPFYYDGTSNLLIGLDAGYQSYECSNTYYTYTTSQNRALGYWNDSYSCLLTSPTTANDIYTYNACIRLNVVSPNDYAWSTGSTEYTITVSPTETTTYTVTVTDDDHDCPAILEYTVRVNPTVEIAPENPMVCPGSEINLTANGDASNTYLWSNFATTQSITVGEGTYRVTATSVDGCTVTDETNVLSLGTPSAGELADMVACQSDYEITLTSVANAVGGGNVQYDWNIGGITVNNTENPEYTLTAADRATLGTGTIDVTRHYHDACGNSGDATATLIINPPMQAPLVTGNTEVACGSTTTLVAAGYSGDDYIYRWYSDPACTNLVAEGATFETPAVMSDTVFYVQVEHVSIETETHTFNYTGDEQVLNIPADATTAVLSVYGAAGGAGYYSGTTYTPGLGGYMTGTIDLTGISQLYVNVGGQGTAATSCASYANVMFPGGYNGGGNSGYYNYSSASYYQGGGGGGATHIATRSGVLSSLENNQQDVLIVAGGGGGGGYSYAAGTGGGLTGGNGGDITYCGQGGTQNAGGTGSYSTSGYTYSAENGSFGQGGRGGNYLGSGSVTGGAGGGGGWYGGGGGRGGNSSNAYSGGGGSGYFNPMLTATEALAGTRSGNGYAEITMTRYQQLSCPTEAVPVHLTMVAPENPNVEVSACVGMPSALTVSNPIEGYSYIWSTDSLGNNPVDTAITFSPTLDGPATYYVRGAVIAQPVTDFSYTGAVQSYTVPAGVSQLQLEVWGAQGGGSVSYPGSNGGYSTGLLNVTPGTQLYVYVGGQGSTNTGSDWSMAVGGYNGGGAARMYNYAGGGGGGATDICTVPSNMTLDGTNRYVRSNDSYLSRIIVAGGGGGSNGGSDGYATSTYGGGSNGGGNSSNVGGLLRSAVTNVTQGGTGTQTAAGNAELYSDDYSYYTSYPTTSSAAGAFGIGATYYSTHTSNTHAGGGGGGWYGGGANCHGSGGGGSGYIYTASTAANYPAGCHLNSSYYLSNAQTIAGSTSFPAPDGSTEVGHTGNGYARITVVGTTDVLCSTEPVKVLVMPFVSPSVTLSASATEACNQEEIELTFTASNDVLSYQFSEGVEERNGHYYVQPGVTTTYTISVSNEGCTVSDDVTITVAAPEVALSVSEHPFCLDNGDEITLEVMSLVAPTCPADVWMNAGTTNIPAGCTINFYDAGGPSGEYASSSDFNHVFTAPAGQHVTLHFSSINTESSWDYIYVYDGNSTSATQLASLTGSYANNTYTSTGNSLLVRFYSDGSVTYPGWEATVSVDGNAGDFAYYWSTGDETESITVNPTEDQTYIVTVSSAQYNCDAVLSYDVHVTPVVTVTAQPEYICEGGSAVLTATGADTYSWNTGEDVATVTKPAGIYAVTGTTEAGCSATGSYHVETVTFSAGSIASDEITICASQTTPINIASLADGMSGGTPAYRWSCNGVLIDGADEASYMVTVAEMTAHNGGDFTYTREFQDGCDGVWHLSSGSYIIHQTAAQTLTVQGNTTVECGTGTTLTASGYTGDDVMYKWYTDENCTQLVHTGATFEVNNVTEDVTYYVQAASTYEATQTQDFSYTGAVQTYTVPAGTESLVLECWGAQGGDATYGGKGGYSVGELDNLNGITNLYVYVGEQPSSTTGGWNGGGGYTSYGTSGGGATDISLHNYTYNTSSHYNDRLIVAGGGGGKGFSSTYGGAGGGISGVVGGAGSATGGGGGTQTTGGTSSSLSGVFGCANTSNSHNGGGGGGGWYGGGSGTSSGTDSGGGGGSGFVWTGQNTVPASYAVPIDYMLADANTIAGNQSMPNPLGGTMTGRSGAGYARITANIHVESGCASLVTAVTINKIDPVAPVITATATEVVCGTSTTLTVQDPNEELLYQWSTDPTFGTILHTGTTYTPVVGGEVTYYVRSIPQNVVVEPQDFSYTGAAQTYTVPDGITEVLLEVWGAEGGTSTAAGGKGGYSSGTLPVTSSDVLHIYVGGMGGGFSSNQNTGGFNGGGGSGYGSSGNLTGTGGGATDIRVNGNTLYSRVIVAGGGGGGGGDSGNAAAVGGAGGGNSGVNGTHTNGNVGSASQSTTCGGSAGTQSSYGYGSTRSAGTQGAFGVGGIGYPVSSSSGGGGGGWYGGGGGDCGGGGGGSGYVYTAATASNYPSGCLLNSLYYMTDAQTIAGNESFLAPDGTTEIGHSGNGYARITPLGTATSNCISANASITITTTTPEAVQIASVSVGCGAPATLEISNAVPGLYYDWYADEECTQLVHQGTSWTIPEVGSNTTYYIRSYGLNQVPGTVLMDSVVSFTGSTMEFMVPPAVSEVTLQLWGAQGGNVYYGANQSISQYGGKGGYAAGTLAVEEGDVLYVNVGGQGGNGTNGVTNVTIPGGFNGGGNGGVATSSSTNYYPGAGGGGATDVRLNSNNISDRILVAGGGGGAAYHATASSLTGGFGGGAAGTDGYTYLAGRNGKGATASTSGAAGTDNSYANGNPGTTSVNGGIGGNGGNGASGGAGGGGGYHGGGGGAAGNPESGAGGGGSGYCSSELTHTANIAGNTRMPSPTGGYTVGRSGDGIAIISYIRPVFDTLCLTEPTAVTISVEPLPTPTVEDRTVLCGTPVSLAVTDANASSYTYIWYADANCTQEVHRGVTWDLDGSSNVSADTVYYVKAYRGLLASSQEGYQEFAYTNDVQVFEVPENAIRLTMEVWGADGGNRDEAFGDTLGGRGGYSVGTLNNLNGVDALYVYVGGRGNGGNGGFNGGQSANASAGGGGGGATDIAFADAAVNSAEHYNSRLIVAGGGGGSGYMNSTRQIAGGCGGGLTGGQGGAGTTNNASVAGGNGGSQVSAGHNDGQDNMVGAFGTANTAVSAYGGGGGGGWYGGASGAGQSYNGGGGGGSGFVWNSESDNSNYAPASYTVDPAYYLVNASTIAGDEANIPAKPVDTHHGYVIIRYYFPEIYLCESEPKEVHIRTTVIDGPEYAYAVDAQGREIEEVCEGEDILLVAATIASSSDADAEVPMVLWFDEDDNFLGASENDAVFHVDVNNISAGFHEFYAYAATDLISMSGSFSLHTSAPVTTGTGRDNTGKGVFVDVTANANLTVDTICFYPGYTGSAQTKVYYRRGSCEATSTNSQGWNIAYSGTLDQTIATICSVPLSVPVDIASGETFTFYVVSDNDLYYRPYGSSYNNTAGIHFGDVLNEYSTSAMKIHAGYGTAFGVAEFGTQHGSYHFIGDIYYTLTGETQFGCVSNTYADTYVEVLLPSSVANMHIDVEDSIICEGGEMTLTAMGGSQGDNAKYVWTVGSCDATPFSQGMTNAFSTVTVSPTVTTSYYVKFESAACGPTECVEKTIYVLHPAVIANITAPERICALGSLGIETPSFTTDLANLGVGVDAKGWQCSEDGVHFVEFTDSTAVSESYNGWWVRYYVTTRCATGYSNAVRITVDSLPVVASLQQPEPMCAPTTFDWDSYVPEIEWHNNSNAVTQQGWRLNINGSDVNFDASQEFRYSDTVKAWYYASNGCGEVLSDTITLEFWETPWAENLTALQGAVCAGATLAIVPPVTHEFGGDIYQGWEYTTTYGSQLYTRFPSDTIIDYGMDSTWVRYYIGNSCGSTHTNAVFMQVNDIPVLGELVASGNTYCSGADFDLDTPGVLDAGGIDTTGSFWFLSPDSLFTANQLTEVNVNDGVDADSWNGRWLRYAVSNACGLGYSNAIQVAVYPSHHLVVTPDFDTVCYGPTYTITAHSDYPDASFQWEGEGIQGANNVAVISVKPDDAGDWAYTVTATEPTHGCEATAVSSFRMNLITKDTSIHICASELPYVFDPQMYPAAACTQSGFSRYRYETANGCDSVVYLMLDVTYPIDRTTRVHYCNHPVQSYIWPVTGEAIGDESMADTIIYRTEVVPCLSSFSDLDGHACDSIVYSLEFTISNEPYLDVPVTDVVMPVNQSATAAFNLRKDCDYPGAKMAIAFNFYKNDTLIDIMSDFGSVSMSTLMPEVNNRFGDVVRIGSGELPGNTFSLYNYDYNYFYADYFCTLDNDVTVSWNEPGEYKLELVVTGMEGGMDYAYTDDNMQVMGGAGSLPNGRVYADTTYIYFHVGAVDTMPLLDTVVCEQDLPFYEYGVQITGPGYYEAFSGNEGNYQMYPINVTVNTVSFDEFTVTLNNDCNSYSWNGRTYSSAGDYTDTVRYATGCDSLITTLHLRHTNDDVVVIDTNVMACGSFYWTANGETYTESGDYTADSTFGNCPATYNLHLTVNSPYDTTLYVTVAPMQMPYSFDDEHVYDTEGTYDIVYQRENGCDSILHVVLTAATTGFNIETLVAAPEMGETAQYDVNVTGGGLDNMKVAIDYEITRNGEIIDNISDYGYVYFSTDYADIHQTIGRQLYTGVGSIPSNSFRVFYYQYTYFYLNFLDYTTNHLTARWDLPGDYKIKFYLRGREGGEDYSLTFDQNNPKLVGGGGSTVLAGDLAVDSVVMHYNIDTVFITIDTTICATEAPFVYHGIEYMTSTDEPQVIEFSDPYLVSDTVVTLSLTVNPAYALYDTAYICQGASYEDHNFTLSADTIAQMTRWNNGEGKAVFTLDGQTAAGCDSIVTLTVYVVPLPTFRINSPAIRICMGIPVDLTVTGDADHYLWFGDHFADTEGSILDGLVVNEDMTVNVTGYVDSLVNPELQETLTCSVTHSISLLAVPTGGIDTVYAAVCQGEPYVDTIFNLSSARTATAGLVEDEVEVGRTSCGIYKVHLMLTVKPTYNAQYGYAEVEDQVCEGYAYDGNGNGFALSIEEIDSLRRLNQTHLADVVMVYDTNETDFGCDSITRLTLHILPTLYSDTTIHFCADELPSFLYSENGQEFVVDGDSTVNVLYQQTTNGCDSIRRVAIVFDPVQVVEVSGTEFCANSESATIELVITGADADTIWWHVGNETIVGSNTVTLYANQFGASVSYEVSAGACRVSNAVSVEPIENPLVEIDTAVCEGTTYVAPDGRQFTESVEQYEWYSASNVGCDIHYILNLTINPVYNVSATETIHVTQLPYVWNGVTFEGAGQRTVNLTASTGCDSVVTMRLQLADTLGGEPFMVSTQTGDNEYTLTAFANRYNQGVKVAIAYSVYKNNVLVNNIEGDCGGELYMGTEWMNTYMGNAVYMPEGYIPGNTFRLGVNYLDYFYFHFLNGRENKISHNFTEAGDYQIVFWLMSRENGDDQYMLYTVNGEQRYIGGVNSSDGEQLATLTLSFTVAGQEEQQGDGTLPALLVDGASQTSVQNATSTVTMTCNGNGYDANAQLSVNYAVLRDGTPLSTVANVADINISTYFQSMNTYVGADIMQGSGNMVESTFNLMNMFSYNYFYLHFMTSTHSRINATWHQPGQYQMVFTLVEMRQGSEVGMTYNGSQYAGGQNAVPTNTVLSTATVNYNVTAGPNGAPMGIAGSDLDSDLDFYPNPARDIVHVQCTVDDAQLTVTDMNGKVVYAVEGTHTGTIELNVSGWSAGVYFVNLRDNDKVITKKLVVTK